MTTTACLLPNNFEPARRSKARLPPLEAGLFVVRFGKRWVKPVPGLPCNLILNAGKSRQSDLCVPSHSGDLLDCLQPQK
jgi:hypothetical protein